MYSRSYLIIDFEATCCDKGSIPPALMEIIEIGAVIADSETLEVVDEFQSFVRPVRTPRLTKFCTELTSIRQEDVDAAPGFREMVTAFRAWLNQHDCAAFCSWGDFDLTQLRQDCNFHQAPYPINAPHINVKSVLVERQSLRKKPGLGEAVRLAGLEFSGTAHRGIDDARNIARLLPFIFGTERMERPESAN